MIAWQMLICTLLLMSTIRRPLIDAARAAHRIAALRALAERGRR